MNLLALLLGWLIAKTIRIGPNNDVPPAAVPPPPGRGRGTTPHTRPHGPRPATPRGSTAKPTVHASTTAPWPQVVPAGLPGFPGSAWVPDNPPPSDVVARAVALLPQLWQGGVGTFKTEKIGARWITFRATDMPGGKRGVVAYRLRDPQLSVASPATAPTVHVGPTLLATTTSPMAPPLLVKGSQGEEVKMVQRRLNVTPTGFYGDMTVEAVKGFQRQHGLTVDGKTGRETWGAMFGGGRA